MKTEPVQEALRVECLIHDISRLRKAAYEKQLRSPRTSRWRWWTIANIARTADSGITQRDLCRLMDASSHAISQIIAKLRKDGLVICRPDKSNRQTVRIFLSKEGQSVLNQLRSIDQDMHLQSMAGISTKDKKIFSEAMSKMLNNLIVMEMNLTDIVSSQRKALQKHLNPSTKKS